MTTVTDGFTRADSTTSAGPDWTNRHGVVGVSGNNAYGVTPGSWDIASHNTAMGSDDMEASITLGASTTLGGWDYVLIMVGCDTSGRGVFAFINAAAGELVVCDNTDWSVGSYTVVGTGSGLSWTVGTAIKLGRVGNLYTGYMDGVPVVSWVDSGNSVPRDSSHRLVAFGTYNDTNGSRAIDSFEASDAGGAAPIPAAADLSGAGTLSAVRFPRFPSAASLAGSGALAPTIKPIVPVAAARSGGGTLSAIVKPIVAVPASLLSTGQLTATVTIPGEEAPPDAGGGWTATPNPPPPARRHGPGWDTVATLPAPVRKGGWFALLEKVAPLVGAGHLSAVLAPRIATRAHLDGNGALSPALVLRNYRAAVLSGNGLPTALMFETRPAAVGFTGSGGLESELNDGLTGIVQVGYGINFSGGGNLVPDVVGGVQYGDGLSAIVVGRYLIPAIFASEGQMVVYLGSIQIALAQLIGSGALGADTKQIMPLLMQMAGQGTLSAEATKGAQAVAALLGTGTISATAFAQYLTSLGVNGAGALTAILMASYQSAGAAGGVGTMAALISQRYFIKTGFGDDFNRADDFAQIGNGWTARNGVMGTYLNGAVPITAANWNEATAPVAMNSDDMEVSWTVGQYIGTPAAGDYMAILLGMNEAGEGVFVFFNGGAGITIYTQADWAPTLAAQPSVAATQAVGDKFTARRVGNVYTVLKNGVSTGLSWTDATNIVPRDANHRLVGLAAYTADAVNARVIDSFNATDNASLVGDGALSAAVLASYARSAALSGGGTLSATATAVIVAPDITSLSASSGTCDTALTINGTNFVGVTSVTIGGVAVRNLVVVNPTTITCNPPFIANGAAYSVAVTTTAGSDTYNSFTYSFSPQTLNHVNAGAYTYNIPAGWHYLDVILLGAGSGGAGGQSFGGAAGNGGNAGSWDWTTWERGVHVPSNTTQVTGSVGTGGNGGAGGSASTAGGATTSNAIAGGSGPRSGAGGAARSGTGAGSTGATPGNATVQGVVYTSGAGGTVGNPGGTGGAPGGGGGGGSANSIGTGRTGGVGGVGRSIFRAW